MTDIVVETFGDLKLNIGPIHDGELYMAGGRCSCKVSMGSLRLGTLTRSEIRTAESGKHQAKLPIKIQVQHESDPFKRDVLDIENSRDKNGSFVIKCLKRIVQRIINQE